RCKDLLGGLRHLELREAWAFDQLDEQEALARAWGSAHALPSQVLDVLRDYQMGSQDCWRRAMYRAGKWAAEDPFAALSRFDQGVSTPAAHLTIATFLRLLDECREARNEYPGGLIRGLIREFLERTGDAGYRPIRGALLKLLIAEGIDPDEVIQACSADRDTSMRWLASEVREDAVLRLVWQTAMVGLG
ncbi:MAG TPA: hypothetical protein VLM40_01660, partial [Gemmata sp.]|nr:hypothetical protein [Gemmata sp.]